MTKRRALLFSSRFLAAVAVAVLATHAVEHVARGELVAVAPLVQKLNAVGPHGAGQAEAVAAWQKLATAEAGQLPEILAGMKGSNPLAENWLRAAVDSVAERHFASGTLRPEPLEKFVVDVSQSPRARRVAYEWLVKIDAKAPDRLLPTMLNDPSLEIRRDAVARALDDAAKIADGPNPAAVAVYQKALDAARDLDQVKLAAEKLRGLGETVDLPRHFGFITTWKLIGPFDNRDKRGFDVAYPPEKEIDLGAACMGKEKEVRWFDHATDDEMGNVDLNKAVSKHMGAVAYAYAEFVASEGRPAELRLGCINANKVWLNGELLTANHVYHANTSLDQYIGRGTLRKGTNTILLKICQNEQTEDWAQNWKFQLRVCDERGTAILSADRK
jgi:hypothetical protein